MIAIIVSGVVVLAGIFIIVKYFKKTPTYTKLRGGEN